MKKLFMLLLLITVIVFSCGREEKKDGKGSSEGATTGKVFKVGIAQIVAHPALDSAREGFKDVFKEAGINVEFEEKNANGELQTANLIGNNFITQKVDLIYSIATPTTQAMVQATKNIPIVFSAISDPISAGVIKENSTGVSDSVDLKQQVELLLQINKNIKKIGIIFNSSEQNSKIQVDTLKKVGKEVGIEVIEKSITQVSEMPQAVDNILREVDALYLPTDNLVASVANLITEKAKESKKIVFGAESAHVKAGALITQGIDYYKMGKEAGKVAIEILKNNKKASEIKFKTMPLDEIVINETTLSKIGITIPENIKQKAKIIK